MISEPFVEYISPAEMLRFVTFFCNYPRGPYVAAATCLLM